MAAFPPGQRPATSLLVKVLQALKEPYSTHSGIWGSRGALGGKVRVLVPIPAWPPVHWPQAWPCSLCNLMTFEI